MSRGCSFFYFDLIHDSRTDQYKSSDCTVGCLLWKWAFTFTCCRNESPHKHRWVLTCVKAFQIREISTLCSGVAAFRKTFYFKIFHFYSLDKCKLTCVDLSVTEIYAFNLPQINGTPLYVMFTVIQYCIASPVMNWQLVQAPLPNNSWERLQPPRMLDEQW